MLSNEYYRPIIIKNIQIKESKKNSNQNPGSASPKVEMQKNPAKSKR